MAVTIQTLTVFFAVLFLFSTLPPPSVSLSLPHFLLSEKQLFCFGFGGKAMYNSPFTLNSKNSPAFLRSELVLAVTKEQMK